MAVTTRVRCWGPVAAALCLSVLLAPVAGAQEADGADASEAPASDAVEAPDAAEGSDDADAPGPMAVGRELGPDDAVEARPDEAGLSSAYLRELRTAEERVHRLKERVFQSKATLQLLKELVVEGAGRGAGVRIVHDHALKKAYDLRGIDYYLDGKPVFSWTADSGVPIPDDVEVVDASVSPGLHTLQVVMRIRGNERVIGYIDDYGVEVSSRYEFDVEGGTVLGLTVRATTRGGLRKSFMERPTLVYEERREKMQLE